MKTGIRILLSVLLVLILVVSGYVSYAFIAYERLPDHMTLEISSPDGQSPSLSPGTSLRLLSYNVGFGAYSDDYSFFMDGGKESRARSQEAVYENIGGAAAAIRAQAPDLILVQEVDFDSTRSLHVDQRQLLQDSLPEYSHSFAQNYDSPYLFWPLLSPHGANKSGILTFSRYPISSATRRSLPIEDGFMKMVDLDRCYSVSRIPVSNGHELVLYNVHLSAYTSDGLIANEQLVMLYDDMLSEYAAGNYVIAGGDFNKDLLGDSGSVFGVAPEGATWAQPFPQDMIPQELRLIAPFDTASPAASCRNADRPYGPDSFRVTVDGFLVSQNIEVIQSQVVETGYRWSDHNPVSMDLILK